jgi:hypothetical protein
MFGNKHGCLPMLAVTNWKMVNTKDINIERAAKAL